MENAFEFVMRVAQQVASFTGVSTGRVVEVCANELSVINTDWRVREIAFRKVFEKELTEDRVTRLLKLHPTVNEATKIARALVVGVALIARKRGGFDLAAVMEHLLFQYTIFLMPSAELAGVYIASLNETTQTLQFH